MKNILTQNRSCFALFLILFLISGCGPSTEPMAGFDPDDESGIGGTGMMAQENTSDTTAIIGAITGFGSIFINGVEIDIPSETVVSENGKIVDQPRFAIGDVLEVLTVPGKQMHGALRIHIRHEINGPVTTVNHEKRSFEIMEQTIVMTSLSGPMPKVGEHLKVSGFRDHDQRIHATRFTISHSTTVFLAGKVTQLHGNTLMIGNLIVLTDHLPALEIGSQINVQGELRGDKLLAHTVNPISALPFTDETKRWIVQGFLSNTGPDQFSIAGIAATAVNANLHELLGGQTNTIIQVEIATIPTAPHNPAIVSIRNPRDLPSGRPVPPPAKTPRPSMFNGTSRPPALPSPIMRLPAGIISR